VTPAALYGLPVPTVATAAITPEPAAAPAPAVTTAATAITTGWHQNPLLVVLLVLAAAFVLSRLAEHGAGLGIWARA